MSQDNDKIMAGGPHLRIAVLGTPDPEYNDIAPGGSITWNQNAIQTVSITGTPTGGTFTLTFTDPNDGTSQTTTGIAYNASAATVKSALEALAGIAVGDVAVSGGALPGTPVVVTFQGDLANTDIAALTADGASLTGGTAPAVSVAETQTGYGYSEPFALCEEVKASLVEKSDDFRPIWSYFRTHDVIVEKGLDRIKSACSQRTAEALSMVLGSMSRAITAADTDQVGLDVTIPDADGARTYYKVILVMEAAEGFFLFVAQKARFEGDMELSYGHMKDKVPVTIKCFANDDGETFSILEQTADATG